MDLGIRGNFSAGESGSIDKCLNFPSRSGKEKFHRRNVFPANRESFIRKMAGLKLVEERKVKNLSPRSVFSVVRVTANSIKSCVVKNQRKFRFFFSLSLLMKSRHTPSSVMSSPSRIDFRERFVRKRIFQPQREVARWKINLREKIN